MQNDFENIDKNTDKNKGATPLVSFEKAWASLQPQLDKEAERRQKKRRRFVFFWLGILSISLVSGWFAVHSNSGFSVVAKNTLPRISISNAKVGNAVTALPAMVSLVLVHEKKESNVYSFKENRINGLGNNPVYTKNFMAKSTIGTKQNIDLKQILPTKISVSSKNINNASEGLSIIKNLTEPHDSIKTKDSIVGSAIVKKAIDTLKQVDTANAKQLVATNSKQLMKKLLKGIHVGFQFNLPLHAGINSFDVNTKRQPFTMVIPQVLVGKQLSKKSSLLMAVTPYSQYYLNNSVVLHSGIYNITIQQGSTQNLKAQQYTYKETVSINKLIAIEATLLYQYQLTNKVKLGVGIANNWLESAILENKITANNATVTHDSLYGIDKAGKEWKKLK